MCDRRSPNAIKEDEEQSIQASQATIKTKDVGRLQMEAPIQAR
jgi:hypothetical protein